MTVTALAADEPEIPRNIRTQFVARAEHDLALFAPADRFTAEILLNLWRWRAGLDDDMRTELLSRFAPAQPVMVPGVDYLPDDDHYEVRCYPDAFLGDDLWHARCACGQLFEGMNRNLAASALTAHATRARATS